MDPEWDAEIERRKAKRRSRDRRESEPERLKFSLPVGTSGSVVCLVVAVILLCVIGIWNTWRFASGQTDSPAAFSDQPAVDAPD